jgi:MOSC domain-containing protein YiiM
MSKEPLVKELLNTIPQVGTVEFISIRPERRAIPVAVDEVLAGAKGLEGDHFNSSYSDKRAVTLIQFEHLEAVAGILQKDIDPLLTRRNIVVSGINLLSLKNMKFRIGEAILEGTGECHPCSRMEENFGPGGYNAMRGHGGLTARVIKDGKIRVGDSVRFLGTVS